ncbi:esterase/lipase family protein, partial [Singulisphaera rosea]
EWRQKRSTLVFFDPAQESAAVVGSRSVPLARDLSTPLAMQVARIHLSTLEWNGLFQSDFTREGVETGLYILRPYQPGKIPVVFVHGLVSSPRAFIQTINELENDPILSARYQFWVFMYPTGLPVPASAARLRESLAKTRDTLDPGHADGALDRMVFVGHSMGGLLSKMMTQDSGLELWNATIQVPYEKLQASPSLEKTIGQALVYQRVPNVSRVVFIASPHRGSPIANELFGRVVSSFIRRPAKFDEVSAEMREIYGQDVISPELRGQPLNAIGNLRTDSPILAALNRIPINPSVPYHSIIPQIGGGRVLKTDGVVEYSSSHLDGATSELIVSGFHSAQQKPEVTAELRRILLVHLGPDGPTGAVDGARVGAVAPASRKF